MAVSVSASPRPQSDARAARALPARRPRRRDRSLAHPPGLGEEVEVVEAREHVVLVVLPVPEQHLVAVARHVPRHPVTVPRAAATRCSEYCSASVLGVLDQPRGVGDGLRRARRPYAGIVVARSIAERHRRLAAVPLGQRAHRGDRGPVGGRRPAARGGRGEHRGAVLLGPAEHRRRGHAGNRALGELVQVVALGTQRVDASSRPHLANANDRPSGVERLQHDRPAVPGRPSLTTIASASGTSLREDRHHALGTGHRDPRDPRRDPEQAAPVGDLSARVSTGAAGRRRSRASAAPAAAGWQSGSGTPGSTSGQHEVLLHGPAAPAGDRLTRSGSRVGPDRAEPAVSRSRVDRPLTQGSRATATSGHSSSQAAVHRSPGAVLLGQRRAHREPRVVVEPLQAVELLDRCRWPAHRRAARLGPGGSVALGAADSLAPRGAAQPRIETGPADRAAGDPDQGMAVRDHRVAVSAASSGCPMSSGSSPAASQTSRRPPGVRVRTGKGTSSSRSAGRWSVSAATNGRSRSHRCRCRRT